MAAGRKVAGDKIKPLEQKVFREFGSMNTQAYRTSIKDQEFAWLENVMAIGFGNLKAVPAQSSTLRTLGAVTASSRFTYNISGSDYVAVFCTDGSAYQVLLTSPYTLTTIGTAATFSGSGVMATQWKNLGLLIIDPAKGYFDWGITVANALSFISSAITSLAITAAGTGYTTRPTLVFTGGTPTTPATGTIDLQLITATASAGGANYLVGDVLTFTGGTFTTAAQVKVATLGGGGAVATVTVQNSGDYTVLPASPAATTGGSGDGTATFTYSFGVTNAVITNAGAGYTAAPVVTVTGGAGSGGTVTATANGTLVGTLIDVYAGRVWIGNNRTVTYTDAASYNSLAGSGGSFVLTDPTLHSSVTAMAVANNFLYIFGSSSINVISDVRVVGGVALFSNVNIQSSVATSAPFSVFAYYRAVFFASKYGFYSLYGSTPQKISDPLDGVYSLIDLTMPIYGGTVLLFNILCAAFMFTYNDPVLGARPLLAVYHNEKWFVSSQGAALKGMFSTIINGVPTMFADDGANVTQLFSSASATIATTIIPKLYDMGDSIEDKQPIKFGFEAINPASLVTFSVTIDSEFGSGAALSFAGGNAFTWTNNAGAVVTWTNNVSATVTWLSAGFSRLMQDVTTAPARGKYLGCTMTSTTPGYQLSQLAWQYVKRSDW